MLAVVMKTNLIMVLLAFIILLVEVQKSPHKPHEHGSQSDRDSLFSIGPRTDLIDQGCSPDLETKC